MAHQENMGDFDYNYFVLVSIQQQGPSCIEDFPEDPVPTKGFKFWKTWVKRAVGRQKFNKMPKTTAYTL